MQRRTLETMLLTAVSLYGVSSRPAAANVYQCDNDRAASQYPNCTNTLLSGWTYRTGTGADWNGDDRLSQIGVTTSYFWNFKNLTGGNAVRLRAWLANAAFTDSSALYFVNFANGFSFRFFDQNSAPNGWSSILQTPAIAGADAPQVELSPTGTGNLRAGADIVELTTFNTLASQLQPPDEAMVDPASCGASHGADPRVAAIQQRMLDAIDNYRDVKGSYTAVFQNNARNTTVDFEISESSPGSYVKVTDRGGQISQYRFDGARFDGLAPSGPILVGSARASSLVGPRHYHNDRCEPVYVHREDPAFAHFASDVAFPQNYAFWLSDSDAKIAGSDMVAGRRATIIDGDHDEYLKTKLGASSFRMWIDDATGALLQLLGTDAQGATVYAIAVQRIQFDGGVDLGHFAIPAPRP